ncbi:sulfite exporter TauE/SafE family protein [Saccharopolyspora rhizosphaerae]|uniref:sulfite exporter TauE/SafE family protein n=1 Tax=Saccharopolyspora rhizosphaerae TaxID=2492662 RepID=UPI001F16DBDC|nr:TSUP family transporter [Saccharopolyspora rhizosphaerae]
MLTASNWPGFADLTLAGLLFLCAAAFLAGAVDAVVGGGELVQLPAMLVLLPGGEVVHSLATSEVAAIAVTSAAARTYATRTPVDWRAALPMALVALLGSLDGAALADAPPSSVLNVVVLVALVVVDVHTWRRPDLGSVDAPRFVRRGQLVQMLLGGAVTGFWDGVAGPGTGSFLVF